LISAVVRDSLGGTVRISNLPQTSGKSIERRRGPYRARNALSLAGFHPRGVFHRHRHSQVGALTVGYLFNVLQTKVGTFGVGGDVTGYSVPPNLKEPYGSPSSYHVFLHYSLHVQVMQMP
jgi:hypothetical protein